MIVIIELTASQLKQLEPLLEQSNQADAPGMIIGQFFRDGMRASFVEHERAAEIQKIQGGPGNHKRLKAND